MLTFGRKDAGRGLWCKGLLSTLALAACAATALASEEAPGGDHRVRSHAALPHVAAVLAAHEGLRIVAFGSSSTEGVGASSLSASYPSRLEANLKTALHGEAVHVVNRGVGGDDVDDMMRRLVPDVVDAHPDLVIWQTGSNDPLRHVPLDRFVAETRAGIATMHRAGIDVVLMEPQYCAMLNGTTEAAAFRQAIRDIGTELHVPVIRRFSLMQRWLASGRLTPAQLLAPDGLHMADGGYAALAEDVASEIIAGTGTASAPAAVVNNHVTSPRS